MRRKIIRKENYKTNNEEGRIREIHEAQAFAYLGLAWLYNSYICHCQYIGKAKRINESKVQSPKSNVP